MSEIDRREHALIGALANARLGFTGRQSLYAKNLETGEIVEIDSNAEVPTASVIKVPIMAALYHEIDMGRFEETDLLALQDEDRRYGTGVIRDLTTGREFSLFDLCRLMIVLSDNTATGIIARHVGIERINEILHAWSFCTTDFRDQTWTPHDPREYAVSSAFELASLLERLDCGSLLTLESTSACLEHLRAQQDHSQLARWLPYHEYSEATGLQNELTIWNKTGQMQGVRTDAALFEYGSARWIVVSLLRDSIDRGFQLDNEGNLMNARTGLAIFDAWGRPARDEE
jgi:beta-lactamase class A